MGDYRGQLGREVVAQLGDETIGGRLAAANRRTVTIAGAWLMTETANGSPSERIELDGTVVIERTRLRWLQALDGSVRSTNGGGP